MRSLLPKFPTLQKPVLMPIRTRNGCSIPPPRHCALRLAMRCCISIQELYAFFIVQPVHDSSQSAAQRWAKRAGLSMEECESVVAGWRVRLLILAPWSRFSTVRCANGNTSRKRSWQSVRGTWPHFGGKIATASTSNNAPGRASSGTPIVVLAGGVAVLTYLSRTSRNSAIFLPISTM